MQKITLGVSELNVTPICLGTMTFGEQVSEPVAHDVISRAVDSGINFIDTAEMYAVPARKETFGATETIIGNWFERHPGMRQKLVLASKVAGPSRGMPWIREGSGMTAQDILNACDASLKRLKTDVIDLYQIHWPERHVPSFGVMYFDLSKAAIETSLHEQLLALEKLVKAGKVRYIGLSNETPYGIHEFVRLAEQHGLPRIVSVQNPYCLTNRTFDNAMDETCHRLNVSLLAYSPLAFGALTGKYDTSGFTGEGAPAHARIAQFETVRKQRWGRESSLTAARLYNQLARDNGMTPTQMALAFCYTRWSVASTIIGVTSVAQLEENIKAFGTQLSNEVLTQIDAIRLVHRDPAT
jgi:aryl-alcohol dehydrogenase-like predicted oxidoreductase